MTLGYVTAHIRQWESGLPRRLATGESPLHQVLWCKQKGRDLLPSLLAQMVSVMVSIKKEDTFLRVLLFFLSC